jgi:hypothetical protein
VRKTLLTLSASVLLGTAVIASNAALAQLPGRPPMGPGGPPVGGPPPGLGAGGPPPGGPPPAHTSWVPADAVVLAGTVCGLVSLKEPEAARDNNHQNPTACKLQTDLPADAPYRREMENAWELL